MKAATVLLSALTLLASSTSSGWAAPHLALSRPEAAELQAATEAKAQVIVLYATNSGKGIDAKIPDEAQAKLKQPPFSSYDSYELLDQSDVAFSTSKEGKLALPNKDELSLKLNSADDKYDVSVSITKPGGKKFLGINAKARKGEMFFVAGPKHKDGILVLGIQIQPK